MSAPGLLDVSGITVRRGERDVVKNVSLGVSKGERVALVGPNAAGKSTLLSSIAGLLPPVNGDVRMDGRSIKSISGREIARQIGLVIAVQEGAPKLSVRESTELGRYPHTGPLRGLSERDQAAVTRAIADTGLADLAQRSLGSLSAGERQRALIARALAQEPKLLLLDEPTAHLDVGHALDLFSLLATIAERGVAIVAVIHDLVSAAHWASRMIVMHEGRIVDDNAPANVMRGPSLGRAFGVTITEAHGGSGNQPPTWRFERQIGG